MKRIVWGVLGLLGLLLVVMVAAPLLVDPNEYKGPITRVVKEATGRELTIGGEMQVSVFPWIGLAIHDLSLGNAPGFGPEPMARVSQAEVRVKLLPLLKGEAEVDQVVVHQLALNLGRDRQGRSNWEDLAGHEERTPEHREHPGGEARPAAAGGGLAALSLGGIAISESQIHWRDDQAGVAYRLDNLNLTTGPLVSGYPVALDLSLELDSQQPAVNGILAMRTRLHPDLPAQRVRLEALGLVVDLKGEPLPGGRVELALNGDVDLDLQAQTLAVTGLQLVALQQVKLEGTLKGSQIVDAPTFSGDLTLARLNPKTLLQRLGQAVPETADPQALTALEGSLKLEATTTRAALRDLSLTLDGSHLTGEGSVNDFGKPAIRFALALDQLDADRYLPPPAQGEAAATGSAPAGGGAAPEGAAAGLPLEPLRSLNLEGSLKAGQLKVANTRYSNLQAGVKAKNGVLRLDPFQADLYQGNMTANATLDVRGDTPKLAVEKKLTEVQIGPLLQDAAQLDVLTGTGAVEAAITASGATPEAIKRTLNGTARFSFTEGMVKGVDIVNQIRRAYLTIKGQLPPGGVEGNNQTEFSRFTGSAVIRNGVVQNDDLNLVSPVLNVTGQGQVDLPADTLDYRVTANLLTILKDFGAQAEQDLARLDIPVHLTGPTAAPRVSVDLGRMITERAKEKVKEKAREKIQEKLGGKAGELLRGLF